MQIRNMWCQTYVLESLWHGAFCLEGRELDGDF